MSLNFLISEIKHYLMVFRWLLRDLWHHRDPFWTDHGIGPVFSLRLEYAIRRRYCAQLGHQPYSRLSWKYTNPPRCYRCSEIVSNLPLDSFLESVTKHPESNHQS